LSAKRTTGDIPGRDFEKENAWLGGFPEHLARGENYVWTERKFAHFGSGRRDTLMAKKGRVNFFGWEDRVVRVARSSRAGAKT